MATVSKHQRVWDYSQAYTLDAYAWDEGHAWDRLACIAGEYARGDISWERARVLCDDTRADVVAEYERQRAAAVGSE